MKTIYILCIIVVTAICNTNAQVQINVAETFFNWNEEDSIKICKHINKIKKDWEKANICLGKDSVQNVLNSTKIDVIPMFFISSDSATIRSVYKDNKAPFYAVLLSMDNVFIGGSIYDASSHKYIIQTSSTAHQTGLHTDYTDLKVFWNKEVLENENVFALTSNYKYPEIEKILFFENNGVLYAISFYDGDEQPIKWSSN